MEKVRLGYIGCGICARDLHWPALQQLKDRFEIVNVCSRTAAKAEAFAGLVGAPRFCTQVEALLADAKVEAVVINYPFEQNCALTQAAIAAGKHVLVEKPMAGDMEQAREMLALEQPGGPVAMIAENFYYRKSVLTAADWIQAGKIGAPTAALVQVLSHFPRDAKWLVESDWRRDCVGGIMLDRDVHWFAAIRTLFGEVRSAVGYQRTIRGDVGPAEQVSLHMIFENGAMGTFTDIASIVGVQQMPFILVGSEGTITIENFQRVTLQTLAGETQTVEFPEGDGSGYVEEFEDFYRAIRTGSTPRASFAQCYKDLQLGMTSLMTNDRWQQLELVD